MALSFVLFRTLHSGNADLVRIVSKIMTDPKDTKPISQEDATQNVLQRGANACCQTALTFFVEEASFR